MTSEDSIFRSMVLHDDACFLCGTHLGDNRTAEHVFPKWLQHKHGLWNQKLNLLNRSSVPYRLLKIPCCAKCNNDHLSRLEIKVQAAFQGGYKSVRKLPPENLYQWLGKIFYGILRKELQLYADLRDKNAGSIIPRELLEGFASLHLFLQSIRRPFVFQSGEHFSTLVVRLHHGGGFASFDFKDTLHPMIVAIQSDDVGVVVALQDAGIIRDTYGRYAVATRGRKLVPLQFDELYAKVLYQTSLMTRVPKFVTAENRNAKKPITVHMLPLAGLSSVPVVKEWKQHEYAPLLAAVLRRSNPDCTIDDIFVPPDKVMSWMNDSSGKLTFFDADGQRIRSGRIT